MSLRLITAPTSFPIALGDAKTQCRVDGNTEDALLTSNIAIATDLIEKHTGRAVMAQTWELVLDAFTDSIMLAKGPVRSITSVTYYDTAGVLQTVDSADYALDKDSDPAWLVRISDVPWPEVADGVNNVIIRYVAGYEVLPPAIIGAALRMVCWLYDNRADGDVPASFYELLINERSFA